MLKIIIYFILLCVTLRGVSSSTSATEAPLISQDDRLSEDGRLSFIGLAAKYGHPATKRTIITDDGYILTLFHIRGRKIKLLRKHILLVHGNTASSDCWIIRGKQSLAIKLAAAGYDVWAINLRGTTDSRKHVTLDVNRDAGRFYNYTFYEHGYYDIPATIDYILKKTRRKSLLAIGHSCATTAFYVMGAERPEYNRKIKAFISLAPICYLQHVRGLASLGVDLSEVLTGLAITVGLFEVFGQKQLAGSILRKTCVDSPLRYQVCVQGILFELFGHDKAGFEDEFLPSFFGHFPEGTSIKLFKHLSQVAKRDKFAQYDYGELGNLLRYKRREPPEIDLSKVTMKVALFVGQEDYLSSVKDVDRLSKQLPNVIKHKVLPYRKFNHADFVWGSHMNRTLYPYLVRVIRKYS